MADSNNKLDAETKNRAALEKAKKQLEQQLRDTSQELQDEKKNKDALEKARKKLDQDLNELRDKVRDTSNFLVIYLIFFCSPSSL